AASPSLQARSSFVTSCGRVVFMGLKRDDTIPQCARTEKTQLVRSQIFKTDETRHPRFPPSRSEADMRNGTWMVLFTLLAGVRAVPAQSKTTPIDEERLGAARAIVSEAVIEAATRLDQKKCSKFFGETAKAALLATDFRVVSYGTPELREGKIM